MLRRQLGRKLESLRKAAGLTMEKAAEELDRARATLYRIESGAENVRFRAADVKEMLKLYGASKEDAELVLAMASATRENKNWWHDYIGSGLPRWFQLYIGLEAAASDIRKYQPELVPGLFQTRAYAEQVFEMPGGSIDAGASEERQRAIQLRIERQGLLTRFSAPQLTVIMNEAVLRRPVGSATIMAEQLHQILKAAELPNVTVQVLTFSAGLHAGAMAGGFSIMRFPRDSSGKEAEPPVAYLEAATGAIYLDKPHEIAAYDAIWADMAGRALNESRSKNLIQQVAEEYSRA
ncbi:MULTISPECIES: helix-turn-helix transcriptional regulator [unclassified Micromonospora]|uniref:helix-turn-helix domain-containing protein n=1 Tax=unclassified Micromonospora TaxID=2617518 RepID=UPI001C239BFC|nr:MULTISPECIES: helix-turn-helix transcriptional regulator [unclassified Micromonospora]MBU8856427.1 helix-turn-helix domain-containing protein [Micromonospora sp. WMMB482]MDM4782037.1 helix-turn-helix transcriptional regulator [Micromonospora sp. b486]